MTRLIYHLSYRYIVIKQERQEQKKNVQNEMTENEEWVYLHLLLVEISFLKYTQCMSMLRNITMLCGYCFSISILIKKVDFVSFKHLQLNTCFKQLVQNIEMH